MDDRSFARVAAIVAIASLPVAAANLLTIGIAVRWNLDALSKPLLLLRTGTAGATWWRASMFLDLLGYYLMIVPFLVFVWPDLRQRTRSWVDLSTLLLLAYSLIGAVGAVILAIAVPPLIRDYVTASATHRTILEVAARGYSDAIYRGIWNVLEEFLAGIGWLILGLVLRRDRRRLGRLMVVLGVACLLDAIGSALNVDAVAMPGLVVYLVLAPVWACWVGTLILRDPAAFRPEAAVDGQGRADAFASR